MRALLIDGDARASVAVRIMLESDGFRVDCSASARNALDLSRSGGAYELVLFDLVLPDPAGSELVRTMRAAHPLRPILALSGADRQQASATALQAGADGFLAKPFGRKDLLARLHALLPPRPTSGHRPLDIKVSAAGNRRTLPIPGFSELVPFQPRYFFQPIRLACIPCR